MTNTRSITASPEAADTFNTAGDTVIGIRPASPEWYDNMSRQQAGLPPRNAREAAPQPAAQSGAALPASGVARAHATKEARRLRAQVDAGRRELSSRYVFTAQGHQVSDPAMLAMRAELVAQIDATAAEADRLDGLDDHQVAVWASARGVL
jgi:hypothetical protein